MPAQIFDQTLSQASLVKISSGHLLLDNGNSGKVLNVPLKFESAIRVPQNKIRLNRMESAVV